MAVIRPPGPGGMFYNCHIHVSLKANVHINDMKNFLCVLVMCKILLDSILVNLCLLSFDEHLSLVKNFIGLPRCCQRYRTRLPMKETLRDAGHSNLLQYCPENPMYREEPGGL